jgi:DNA-binding beta-propeller fold protein YncE
MFAASSNETREEFLRGPIAVAAAMMAILAVACGRAWVNSASAKAQNTSYHLVKKVTLGGDGSWDYFDVESTTHRVFIPRRTHVMVVDAIGKLLADLPIMGSHAIAFAPEFNRVFTSDNEQQTVTIVDPATLEVTGKVKLPGRNSDGILYDPASKRLFTFNTDGGNDSTAIDAKTGKVVGSVPLGSKPESAQSSGTGRIFVNMEERNQIIEFDSTTLKVLNAWPIAPCKEPSGLAIDVVHKRLFAGCHNKLMAVIDYTDGKVVATVPIGEGVDANRFDPGTGLVFASCGDGTITVAQEESPNKYTVVQTISTLPGARTMAIDTSNHNVYTVTATFGPAAAAAQDNPRPRPAVVPNTFTLLIYSR